MKNRLIVILVLCGFFFSNFDLHADHEGSTSTGDQCCVQCCPTHNLAPRQVSARPPLPVKIFGKALRFSVAKYIEPFLPEIDPPPISSVV